LAVLADRERIARDLHDGVIQPLYALGMELAAVAGSVDDAVVAGRIHAAVERLDTVIKDIRTAIFALKPTQVTGTSVSDALRRLTDDVARRTGIVVEVYVDPAAADAVAAKAAEVVHFAREAMSNVARHSQARSCQLTLRKAKTGIVILKISDDGRGFDTGGAGGAGDGLANLEVRAAALGGRLEVDSRPRRGSVLRVVIPVAGPSP
jgi:signal transduction histidine kinase